ncbi:MAG TPA: CsgG/HfaB family protein, partial [Rectinemataceae bacterium]|nr:CsgG/HfaB family protein [Rectinemataceae bacterium]
MKRASLAFVVALLALNAWAQPKVAVLDTIIPDNMDPSVIIPTTDKIDERLVVSGRFLVLDRANIASVLKEREFQVSGMVSDQDIVQAGKYLGADFVVVARVQKVSDTYFISAKMIAVKTGVIANQTSATGEGKLSALIDLASQVGDVLSGGAVLAQSAAGQSDISKPVPTTTNQPKPKPAPRPQPEMPKLIIGAGVAYSLDQFSATASDSYGNLDYKENWNSISGAFEVWGKYFQASVGIAQTTTADYSFTETYYAVNEGDTITSKKTDVRLNLFGRLPFSLGPVTLFALAGGEYEMNISWIASDGSNVKDTLSSDAVAGLNHIFLQVGGGAQFALGGNFYIAPQIVYGWKLKTKDDTDFENYLATTYSYSSVKSSEGRLDIRILAGMKI